MTTPSDARSNEIPNGLAAAALVAGGIGSLAVGVMTCLVEASEAIKNALVFYSPAGPLSGKTTVAVAVWLIAWVVLARMWKNKDVNFARAATVAMVLLGLGLVTTFPPVFVLFAAE